MGSSPCGRWAPSQTATTEAPPPTDNSAPAPIARSRRGRKVQTEGEPMARKSKRQPPAERYGKGTAEWVGRERGYWVARVSVPGQKRRPRIKLSTPEGRLLVDHEGDRALAIQLAEGVSELVRAKAF